LLDGRQLPKATQASQLRVIRRIIPGPVKFGIYNPVENAAAIKAAGWDFVEENVQTLLQGHLPDEQWKGVERTRDAVLSVPAANRLVPAELKLIGPARNVDQLRQYITRVLDRAGRVGVKYLVFGSGAARTIPEGVDRATGRRHIIEFLEMAVPIAQRNDVTLVAEPLYRVECNIMNSVAECMEYVRELDHPNFQCLVDSFHLWCEKEPLDNLAAAMPWIKHVHVSEIRDRMPPGETDENNDYRSFFRVLRQGGYDGMITVEANAFDVPEAGSRVLAFLKDQWNRCL
jgi:sugar phosphate isomerase/epimerase